MINHLNRQKYEERDCGVQSNLDFSFVSQPNLDFKPSVDVDMSVEEDGIERLEKGGV